jgi:murein DD-endopeptidase MepM/ murein hydrolase activator NlpD
MTAVLLAALLAAAGPDASGAVLAPSVARPGDVVLVRVRTPDGAPPAATLAGRPLLFWARGGESWAVAGLPIETPPGPVRLELSGAAPGDPPAATLEVVEPGFPSRSLTVAQRFVEPPRRVKARIARDQAAFAAAYARPPGPPLFSGSFDWPRRARTTGRFGDQRVLNGTKKIVHYGLDIAGPRGAPVVAANDGEVVLARDCYYSGKTVVVWHGADLFTLYFHLDRMLVRPGAKVEKGQRLGRLGSTGRSTGPHLHWSARAGGLLVDPESLLAIDFASGEAPPRRAGPPPEPPAAPEQAPAEVPPVAHDPAAAPTAAPEAAPAAPVSPVPPGAAPPAAAADLSAPAPPR